MNGYLYLPYLKMFNLCEGLIADQAAEDAEHAANLAAGGGGGGT